MPWSSLPAHHRWLEAEADRLLAFARRSVVPDGFGWLDDDGAVVRDRPTQLWITCRTTYVMTLGALLGRPGCGPLADHGLAALAGPFHDDEHGGWFAARGPHGQHGPHASAAPAPPEHEVKDAYPHAFVVLATASAAVAGRPGARELLDRALEVQLAHFWDDDAGMVVESWDRTFRDAEEYRGVNANMHTVEAYLAAADATGDRAWLDRALRITERVVHGFARGNGWRLPEHYDARWRPLLEYNADAPAHPFRPYGATIGHAFEWARLTLHVAAALEAAGTAAPSWAVEDATALLDAAVRDGWGVDGAPGFVYTVDWSGRPVVAERMHWVLCEAIGAAAALHRVTGEARFDDLYRQWWDHAAERFVDLERGSWRHETAPDGGPSATVWAGKPDVYHALQATLVPRLPLAPALAPALAEGLLDVRHPLR